MSEKKPTVFVIDDDSSMREALANLFSSVGLAVQTYGGPQEYLARAAPDEPGCLVLDVRLPGLSGLDLQKRLVEADIQIPIIFITGHGDIEMSVRAMKAGAVEFLTKPFREQELLDAVQQAMALDRTARQERTEVTELRAIYSGLSPREQEVMGLVTQGLLNKQIAAELGTSEATVKMHRGHLMQKMQADSLADLIKKSGRLALAKNK